MTDWRSFAELMCCRLARIDPENALALANEHRARGQRQEAVMLARQAAYVLVERERGLAEALEDTDMERAA